MTYDSIVVLKNGDVWGVWKTEPFNDTWAKQLAHEFKQHIKSLDPDKDCEDEFAIQFYGETTSGTVGSALDGIKESLSNEIGF